MADVIINILTEAQNRNLLTLQQARTGLAVEAKPEDLTTSDEFLTNLIEITSDVVSVLTNRVFAREEVRETWRCLGEPCDCADAKKSRRLFLSHWPVREADIESVEVPRGYPVDSNYWELDERAGRISIFSRPDEPIVVTYWGGFVLPDEAPPALRHAAMLLVSNARAVAKREALELTGIKSIGHKESRVTFQSPSETAVNTGIDSSPALGMAKNLLSHFTRYWA